jgi:hypothetical protein
MDFPGRQELAQRLALEWAALMEALAHIQYYFSIVAAVALIVYLACSAWFRLKRRTRAATLRRRRVSFNQINRR